MDSQTWSSALKQVGRTIAKWPVLIACPISYAITRLPEPASSVCAIVFVVFWLAWGVHLAIWTRRRLRAIQNLKEEMDENLRELDYLLQEFNRLSKESLRLHLEGKEAESLAVAGKMQVVLDRWAEAMKVAAGLKSK